MGERKRLFLLVLIMTTVSLVVAGITIHVLYGTAFEEQRERLVETAQSQARLIEAVARFDAAHERIAPGSYPGGAAVATLSQITDAHKNYKGFGETGEFTLARRQGDNIVFLLRHRHFDLDQPKPVSLNSKLAEPMRRALSGLSGTVVGVDYRGEVVLAAYEPVAELDLGIVAKIDLAEVRAPFVKAGITSVCAALLVVIIGAGVFLRVSNPIVNQLEERTLELTRANQQLELEIQERKGAEEALSWEASINAAIAELSSALILPKPIDDISWMVLEYAKNLTKSPFGFVGFIEPETGYLISVTMTRDVWDTCHVPDKEIVFKKFSGLWGWVLDNREPLLTNSPSQEPMSSGTPPGHIPIERFLSVPAIIAGSLVGQIALANSERDYTERDLSLIQRLATLYAIAIQRNQAEEKLQQAHAVHEMRVEKRTAELVKAYEKLKQSEKELRLLSSQRLTVQEQERGRIARELHDGIGQSLSAIKFRVEDALGHMAKGITESSVTTLNNLIPVIQSTVEEVRKITMDLRPSTLDDLGILATIAWFCREFQETYSTVEIEKEITVRESDVPEPLKIVLYRVLQEALNNVAKHSGANRVTISLAKKNNTIQLAIKDNGCGFDLDEALAVDSTSRGFGLGSMRERAELSGGHLSIEPVRREGTTIRASWPG